MGHSIIYREKEDDAMDREELYRSVFRRKSVRRYDMTPLDSSVLEKVEGLIPELEPLWGIKTDLRIVPGNDIRGMFAIRAPHYLVLSSETGEGYLENAGFMLQQMDLALSSMGLGSCWVGMAKPPENMTFGPGMEFVIAMAFGKPVGSPYRNNSSEYHRKPLDRISDVRGDEVLEAARLAPSSVNSQPWYFIRKAGRIDVYCVKHGYLKPSVYSRLNRIDIGIACCHIWLAELHHGRNTAFARTPESAELHEGYDYVLTISEF